MKRKRLKRSDPQTQARLLAMAAMGMASMWWLVSLYFIWTAAGINSSNLMFYALLLLLLSVGVTIGSWGSQRQPLQGAMVSLAGGVGMLILSAAALNAVLFWALQPSNLLILAAAALMYALPYLIVGGLQLRLHRSLQQAAAEEALLPAAEAEPDVHTKLALNDASPARGSPTAHDHILSSDSERTQRASQ